MTDNKKKRGRPIDPNKVGNSPIISMRFQSKELDALDAFILTEPDSPSRPEAIRRLIKAQLKIESPSG